MLSYPGQCQGPHVISTVQAQRPVIRTIRHQVPPSLTKILYYRAEDEPASAVPEDDPPSAVSEDEPPSAVPEDDPASAVPEDEPPSAVPRMAPTC
ncbi:hypothetical protein Tco_1208331 [Tanacetum coccineum]